MNHLMSKPSISTRGSSAFQFLDSVGDNEPGSRKQDRDELFLHMLEAYRGSGGLYRGGDVNALLEGRGRHTAGTVDKWMDRNEVIHFEWQCLTWLPRFQFDMVTKAPLAEVGLVATELAGVYDKWETALWFAHPSSALEGRVPADAMRSDPDLVIQAARRDRRLAIA
ncbi:hypothetical protein [Hydrogenophaga sp.]|uniref:hypothetical protein n=1 Tax=Hydrogenophaga sp. TaxID=1904254 RepID=UPI00271FC9C9|nr:hypothetical protein [Hydrogenophaga sp.]MDO8906773.1 hypothetical protein [Hydrogenophaga sp.]